MKKFLLLVISSIYFLTSDTFAQTTHWAFGISGQNNQVVNDLVVDQQKNVIAVGKFFGSNVDFDPSPSATAFLSATNYHDIFIAKYDSLGNYVWAFKIGGPQVDAATHVTVDSFGNIYVSGFFRGSNVDFDPSPTATYFLTALGSSSSNTVYGGDAFLAKYTPAGALVWAFNVGGSTVEDMGGEVVIDKSGNVLWAGAFSGNNIDFDPSSSVYAMSSVGTQAVFLSKYSSNGQLIWAKSFGGAGCLLADNYSITIDKNDALYVSGKYRGTIDLDPGVGIQTISTPGTTTGCHNLFLVKLDSLGQYSWGFQIGATNCTGIYGSDLVVDSANNVCMAGYFTGMNVDFDPGPSVRSFSSSGSTSFIAKYSASGAMIFANAFSGCQTYSLAKLNNGFVIAGEIFGTTDFDPGPGTFELTSAGNSDIFVSCYDFNGAYRNAFRIGSDLRERAYTIFTNSSGEVFIGGEFQSNSVDFDPSATHLIINKGGLSDPSPSYDAFVAKYSNLDNANTQLYNTLTGYSYIDKNLNGVKDSFEPFYKPVDIITKKGNIDSARMISGNGMFKFNIDTGSYFTSIQNYIPYYNAVPTSKNSYFSTYGNTDTVLFGLQPIPGKKDVSIAIIPGSSVRPGAFIHYKLIFINKGTDTIPAGSIQFVKSPLFSSLVCSPQYTTVNGDTIIWNYNDLKPLDTGSIRLQFKMAIPPLVSIGDTINTFALIYPIASDQMVADNHFNLRQRVTGAFDPNDKTESHDGSIKLSEVANREFLYYTIRFQNTGNDTAFNIYIRDTLDAKLDWNSLEVISGSHNYQLEIEDGKFCKFQFLDINLVDSFRNEPLSHGYISYRIKPRTSLLPGDLIKNTASIYFDFNLPVVTNTVNTQVITETALPLKLLFFKGSQLANGSTYLYWATSNEINTHSFAVEESEDGRTFRQIGEVSAKGDGNNSYSFTAPFVNKPVLYYRLKMIDNDDRYSYSNTIAIRHTGKELVSFTIDVNPVRERLTVTIVDPQLVNTQAVLINSVGKVVHQFMLSAGTQSIDVRQVAAGLYYLKTETGSEKVMVIR